MARILLVEDNPANIQLAMMVLEVLKHELIVAADALDGIRLAEESEPDLILMDIQLPGMDGLKATHFLKENPVTKDIKIVALTALAREGDEERILAAGCDGYISKPIQYDSFAVRLSRFLPIDPKLSRFS